MCSVSVESFNKKSCNNLGQGKRENSIEKIKDTEDMKTVLDKHLRQFSGC